MSEVKTLKHRDLREWEPLLGRTFGPGYVLGVGKADTAEKLIKSGRWAELKPVSPRPAKYR